LPSLEVPSANSTTGSPPLSRAAGGFRAALAVDEHRALKPRQQTEQRPGPDLALGDKHHRGAGGQHRDVEPGDVIGGDQQVSLGEPRADLANAHAQQRADDAVIEHRDAAAQRPLEPQR
jgi:hypothetical protein